MTILAAKDLACKIVIGRYESPPVKVLDYVEEAGLQVQAYVFEGLSMHSFMSPDKKIIYVEHNDTDQQKRFSICYQLALWYNFRAEITEDPDLTVFKTKSALKKRTEMEEICYKFAADLLIPDDLLKIYHKDTSIADIAKIFHVDPKVVCEKV